MSKSNREISFLTMWFRWSIVLCSLIALGFGVYVAFGGVVGSAHGISHWFAIVAPAVIAGNLFGVLRIAEFWEKDCDVNDFVGTGLVVCVFLGTLTGIIAYFKEGALGLLWGIILGYALFLVGCLVVAVCLLIASLRIGRRRSIGEWLLGIDENKS